MLPLFVELMFLETSAMTGENVEESFLKCSRVILNKIENGRYHRLCHEHSTARAAIGTRE